MGPPAPAGREGRGQRGGRSAAGPAAELGSGERPEEPMGAEQSSRLRPPRLPAPAAALSTGLWLGGERGPAVPRSAAGGQGPLPGSRGAASPRSNMAAGGPRARAAAAAAPGPPRGRAGPAPGGQRGLGPPGPRAAAAAGSGPSECLWKGCFLQTLFFCPFVLTCKVRRASAAFFVSSQRELRNLNAV